MGDMYKNNNDPNTKNNSFNTFIIIRMIKIIFLYACIYILFVYRILVKISEILLLILLLIFWSFIIKFIFDYLKINSSNFFLTGLLTLILAYVSHYLIMSLIHWIKIKYQMKRKGEFSDGKD